MGDENKRNIQYFEAASMAKLFNTLENWQLENRKRFLSVSIEKDSGMFCCICLTNPSEVVILGQSPSSSSYREAWVNNNALMVT